MVSEFLTYQRLERNRSPLTVEAYGRDLRLFAAWLEEEYPGADISSVGSAEVRRWLAAEAMKGNSPTTLRRKAQSLRSFYRWATDAGRVAADPMEEVKLAKIPKPLPVFIRHEDVEKALGMPQSEDPMLDFRNKLIIELLYTCGVRQAELTGLTDADIDFSRGEMRITGKGGKQRVVPMLPEVARLIHVWQKMRDGAAAGERTPRALLPGRNGGPLSRSRLYGIVREALLGAKSVRKSPHTLRHSFATSMLAGGADIVTVKEMLGHSSLSSTQIYTHLDFNQLQKDYAKAHPRGEEKK